MSDKAVQDCYIDEFAHCFGCGRLNKDGMQIKSYWNGEDCVCHYTPKPYYTGGFPGFIYGGLISSLIDCHGIGGEASGRGFHSARPRSFTFCNGFFKSRLLETNARWQSP